MTEFTLEMMELMLHGASNPELRPAEGRWASA
jgi:hypothetical protein